MKKALRKDVARRNYIHKLGFISNEEDQEYLNLTSRLTVFSPGLPEANQASVRCTLEGPHYPAPHRWYASATLEDMVVVGVK